MMRDKIPLGGGVVLCTMLRLNVVRLSSNLGSLEGERETLKEDISHLFSTVLKLLSLYLLFY